MAHHPATPYDGPRASTAAPAERDIPPSPHRPRSPSPRRCFFLCARNASHSGRGLPKRFENPEGCDLSAQRRQLCMAGALGAGNEANARIEQPARGPGQRHRVAAHTK